MSKRHGVELHEWDTIATPGGVSSPRKTKRGDDESEDNSESKDHSAAIPKKKKRGHRSDDVGRSINLSED